MTSVKLGGCVYLVTTRYDTYFRTEKDGSVVQDDFERPKTLRIESYYGRSGPIHYGDGIYLRDSFQNFIIANDDFTLSSKEKSAQLFKLINADDPSRYYIFEHFF